MTRRYISELRFSASVEDKLASHGVEALEVLEVLWDGPRFFRDKVDGRTKMIGKTPSGRLLTVIVEPTQDDPTSYDVITAWAANKAERTAWGRAK